MKPYILSQVMLSQTPLKQRDCIIKRETATTGKIIHLQFEGEPETVHITYKTKQCILQPGLIIDNKQFYEVPFEMPVSLDAVPVLRELNEKELMTLGI